ncbi:MAG TPA: hypothetical protein VKE74_25825 [Gemmataceae bacterium]|nr:hypothetical protein [Gemmataceae bacterium]
MRTDELHVETQATADELRSHLERLLSSLAEARVSTRAAALVELGRLSDKLASFASRAEKSTSGRGVATRNGKA